MKSPILGSSYVARSVNAADNRMVNLFPEIIPDGGKENGFLSRAPGLTLLDTIGNGPIRGMIVALGFLYVVSGSGFYSVSPSLVVTRVGDVANDGTQVSMAVGIGIPVGDDSPLTRFIMIACNGPSYLAIIDQTGALTLSDNLVTTFDGFPSQGALTVAWINGYFLFNSPGTENVWGWYTPTIDVFDPLLVLAATGSPDNVVGVISDHRELWVFGEDSVEVWADAGVAGFPFQPIQGAYSEVGCASTYSIAKMDNSIFWLGRDDRGHGIVYRAEGYTAKRISTHAVEWQIQQYGDLSSAIAYTYQQDGHAFYVLSFPSQSTTWVYDAATQAWHERAAFSGGSFSRHRSNCQTFFNNLNLVGDYENGNIYSYDLSNYTDNGEIQKCLRSWRALPAGSNNLNRTTHHSLQLDCETGVGLNEGQGSDPQVMLRWSDDGGHTWSSEHWVSMGRIGQYSYRAKWYRLGMTLKLRDRVYEVSVTDPVKVAIMGAELHLSNTNA